jgi:hypothetical protein
VGIFSNDLFGPQNGSLHSITSSARARSDVIRCGGKLL